MSGRLIFALVLAAGCITGCDWDHRGLMNGLPLEMDLKAHPSLHVFLGVDGISREAIDLARAKGAFADFSVATMVPMYPATSDASWTRILHAPQLAGYEYTFYDGSKDEVMNAGLGGLVGHAVPVSTFDDDFPYYRAFEFHGSGYFEALEDYADPVLAFTRGIEELFPVLAGRLGATDVATAYVVEPDVAAHALGRETMVDMLVALSSRIGQFKLNHREFDIDFTLVSDHGSDHSAKFVEVDAVALARRVGVTPVQSMAEGSSRSEPWAVAIEHTRTTYGVMHTSDERAESVAARVSTDDTVDLVVAKALPFDAAPPSDVFCALYRSGQRVGRISYESSTDTYWIDRDGDWPTLGLAVEPGDAQWLPVTDAMQFEATVHGAYPDLLHRARTSIDSPSIRSPAQVVYSLRDFAVMRGIAVPGTGSLGASGSHGAMGGGGSRGVLLSQHRHLEGAIRSDDVLALFPDVQQFIAERFRR